MRIFWYWFYNILVIPTLWVLFRTSALFNKKIRKGIQGRKNLFEKLEQDVRKLHAPHRIWIHSSSLGEFEQAKPIIAELRSRLPRLDIIVSFFSPSGYEHVKHSLADLIVYLPFDTPSNARRFIDLIRPDVAVNVRYDVWPNFLWELHRRNIPSIIVNAILHKHSSRLMWPLSSFHYHLYECLSSILAVSQKDAAAFRYLGLKLPLIETVGETRYDQVKKRSEEAKKKHLIPQDILRRRKVFVVGSSWDEDGDVILPAFRKIARHDSRSVMILVPHEPTIPTLERLELELVFQKLRPIRFSHLNDYSDENVILVDGIGILMALYQYADVSYVGGSFKQGIHNVLEPAVYGSPVIFGPKHKNSREAIELANRGGGFVVTSAEDCYPVLRRLFNDRQYRLTAGKAARSLVDENVGATQRFVHHLSNLIGASEIKK